MNTVNKSLKSDSQELPFTATSGLLPTPQAIDGQGEGRPLRLKKDMPRNPETPGSWRGDLKDHIATLLPTPEAKNSEGYQVANGKQYPRLGKVLTSSQAASPANLFPKPDEERERTITATSGRKCLELYELSNRHGSSLKTCVASLLSSKAWYSNKCALTWKPVVTKSNRLLFQLSPSMRRTEGIGSGLLPTARNRDYKGATQRGIHAPGDGIQNTLNAMLPTASTRDWKGKRRVLKDGKNISDSTGTAFGLDLNQAVEAGIRTGLKLQPNFVAWMMGYPLNWTDLNYPKADTGQNNWKLMEMQ